MSIVVSIKNILIHCNRIRIHLTLFGRHISVLWHKYSASVQLLKWPCFPLRQCRSSLSSPQSLKPSHISEGDMHRPLLHAKFSSPHIILWHFLVSSDPSGQSSWNRNTRLCKINIDMLYVHVEKRKFFKSFTQFFDPKNLKSQFYN